MTTTVPPIRLADLHYFLRCQAGATSIEYALIASGIALAIIVVVAEVGVAVEERFAAVRDGFN